MEIRIEQQDKYGAMIGTMTVGNTNLALALVEEGLATVLSTTSDRTLTQAEKIAKEKKIGVRILCLSIRYRLRKLSIFSVTYCQKSRCMLQLHAREQEEKKDVNEDDKDERELNYKDVMATVVSPELRVYAQQVADKTTLAELESKLRAELASSPISGFTKERPPLKGAIGRSFAFGFGQARYFHAFAYCCRQTTRGQVFGRRSVVQGESGKGDGRLEL